MDPVHEMLIHIWFTMIGLILILYVVLDGFDLGVGVLTLFTTDEAQRGTMMTSISGVWDANETWLVLLGGALFGAFPIVYGIVLHALYVPISLLLFGLIFRGVAFEFREHARRKRVWDLTFGVGSLIAALAQGLILGAIIHGIETAGRQFVGGTWDWLTPFALLVGIGVTSGYALLGASYLVIKTDGVLQSLHRCRARIAFILMVAAALGVTVWTPFLLPHVWTRWFSLPSALAIAPLPLIASLACLMLWRALTRETERAPFVWSLVIFISSFCGLAASLYPYIVPPNVLVWEAGASAKTLLFMLVGIGFLMPVMITYNAFQYRVFRGKLRHADYAD